MNTLCQSSLDLYGTQGNVKLLWGRMGTMNNNLTVCSMNVNGLQDNLKRKDMFEYLRELEYSIYFLQETHITETSENFIRSAWGYNAWAAGCDTNKNGVAILFNNNFEYKLHNVVRDKNGQYIFMDIEMLDKRITLVNLYGPSAGDQPAFFDTIGEKIKEFGNNYLIVGGDWNVVMDMNMDARNYRCVLNRPRSRESIKKLILQYDLIDVWRHVYPEKRKYTWRKFNTAKQGRLDYFLLSEELLSVMNGVKIESSYRSDHSLISVVLKRGGITKGKSFWKFNNSLLRDGNYIKEIKQVIYQVKKQYARQKDLDLDKIPNKDLELDISEQLFFETLLLEIRGKTISYASYRKREEKKNEKDLLEKIQLLESGELSDDSIALLEKAKVELQEIRMKRIEGMAVRSKAKWLAEGEKVSKYFCNLENRHFLNKSMNFIEKEDGKILYDQTQILEEVQQFYSNLYSHKDVEDVDLSTIDVPKLSQEDNKMLEGNIAEAEALEALRQMKNDKSPGSDGFTTEFFKVFWKDIGTFLVRSINCGFEQGELSVTQKEGIITCIPKENKPRKYLKNWRPITLLNTTYKIASACIANRLKKILPKIIHEDQKGFIKGRYIGENIRLLYDTLVYTEKENIPGLLLMIDFEKAFDSVSWSFIEKSLDAFNFGPSIKRWVRTFYNNIKTCVTVNGQYTRWFPVCRGVRQGDPSSPYLYLICAEILSCMIRNNENIKGIKLREKETLLSQFADDTTLFLDGSERSFTHAIQTIKKFADISGLKMNYDKTQVVWIGNRKHSDARYMRDMNFCWDPGIFRVLGVNFSLETDQICTINFTHKLEEIKNMLKVWSKRQLTPLGKITVIKTLAISKITHLFIALPDPSEAFLQELNAVFFQFLWDGKRGRINKSVVCKPHEEGGLNMLNVYTFLSGMKIMWLKRICGDSSLRDFITDMYPMFADLKKYGSEYANVLMVRVSNPFWKDVLKHYKRLYAKCFPRNLDEFLAECVHYNVNIIRDGKVVYLRKWSDNDVFLVRHLVSSDGRYLTFDEFKTKFPQTETNFVMYEGVISAIRKFQKKAKVEFTDQGKLVDTNAWNIIGKGNKAVQATIAKSDIVPTSVQKWNTKTEANLDWGKIFRKCKTITKDERLRWFQIRLLHRILPTNKFLHMCRIVDSSECTFCNQEEETICHLFWDCHVTQKFWADLFGLLKNSCAGCANLEMNKDVILFNIQDKDVSDPVIDLFILMAKYYLHKCKLQGSRPIISVFHAVLRQRYTVEKYYSQLCQKSHEFNMKWYPYTAFVT